MFLCIIVLPKDIIKNVWTSDVPLYYSFTGSVTETDNVIGWHAEQLVFMIVYDPKSMFIGANGNGIFYHSPITLSCEYTNHTADSQLKINNAWYDNVKKTILVTNVNLFHMDKWICNTTLQPHTCSSHVTTEIALLKIKEDWQGIKMLNMWTPKNLQTITNSTSQQQRPQKRHPSSDLVYPNLV